MCRHSCRLCAQNLPPGSSQADSCTPRCSQNQADPSPPRPHGAGSPAACRHGLEGRRRHLCTGVSLTGRGWMGDKFDKRMRCNVSYVCTQAAPRSKSDQAGRFERKSPESNDLAGTEMTPHSPPVEREREWDKTHTQAHTVTRIMRVLTFSEIVQSKRVLQRCLCGQMNKCSCVLTSLVFLKLFSDVSRQKLEFNIIKTDGCHLNLTCSSCLANRLGCFQFLLQVSHDKQ